MNRGGWAAQHSRARRKYARRLHVRTCASGPAQAAAPTRTAVADLAPAIASSARRYLEGTRPGYLHSHGRVLVILVALMVAILLASLDQAAVATALPHIVSDIGGVGIYSWVFTAYLLCQTVAVPIFGRLGDAYGRRGVLLSGIAIFLLGSVLSGAAPDIAVLVASRCIQGVGAGGIIPVAVAVVADVIPPRERGRYQAMVSAGVAGGAVIGPAVGGAIADNASWRWVFFLNVPTALLALALVWAALPATKARSTKIDYGGASLLGVATTSLLISLSIGGVYARWLSVPVLGGFVIALTGTALLIDRARRTPSPILPLPLIRDPIVASGATGAFVGGACMLGTITYVPLFAQGVLQWSASASGLILTPLALAATAVTVATGQWVTRTGRYRPPAVLGPLVLGTGMLMLWRMNVRTTHTDVVRDIVVVGIGMGLMMQMYFLAVQNAVRPNLVGTATALVQFSRTIGTVVGVAVFGAVMNFGLDKSNLASARATNLTVAARTNLASAIRPSFLVGAGMAALATLVVARGLKHQPLRSSVFDPSDTNAKPVSARRECCSCAAARRSGRSQSRP